MPPRVTTWDVWFADLDPTKGNEQAGDRPVVIVSTALHLRIAPTLVTVLPMTTRHRDLLHRVPATLDRITGYVITEQVRTISRARLRRRLGTLGVKEISEVRAVLARMIDLPGEV